MYNSQSPVCLGAELFITVDLLGLFLFTDEQRIRQNVYTLLLVI